jgi:hypothetical protein
VVVVARAATTRVLLLVTVPWLGTLGVILPPLIRSYEGDVTVVVQEPGMVELNVEELCVEELFHF